MGRLSFSLLVIHINHPGGGGKVGAVASKFVLRVLWFAFSCTLFKMYTTAFLHMIAENCCTIQEQINHGYTSCDEISISGYRIRIHERRMMRCELTGC